MLGRWKPLIFLFFIYDAVRSSRCLSYSVGLTLWVEDTPCIAVTTVVVVIFRDGFRNSYPSQNPAFSTFTIPNSLVLATCDLFNRLIIVNRSPNHETLSVFSR